MGKEPLQTQKKRSIHDESRKQLRKLAKELLLCVNLAELEGINVSNVVGSILLKNS